MRNIQVIIICLILRRSCCAIGGTETKAVRPRLIKDGYGGYKIRTTASKTDKESDQVKGAKTTDKGGDSAESRIINGDDATQGRFPYTVSLQLVSSLSHFCGGSLIAPDIVMTAAHCVQPVPSMAARINAHTLYDPQDASEIFAIEESRLHPLYLTESSYDHDFALLKLANSSIHPFVQLNQDPLRPISEELLIAMGWGTTQQWAGLIPNVLQIADVFYVDNEQCELITVDGGFGSYVGQITDDMLCAIEAGQGSCQGDSGGPLIIAGDNFPFDIQVGVVSWGIECALESYPGVYGRVSEEFPFIRSGVCDLSTNPPEYFRCEDDTFTFSPAPSLPPALPSVSPGPTVVPEIITVQITPDLYPGEVGWTLADSAGNIVKSVPKGTYQFAESIEEVITVLPNDRHRFTLEDSFGDGLCCSYGEGSAIVFLGEGVNYARVLAFNDGRYRDSSSLVVVTSESGLISFEQPSVSPTTTIAPTLLPTLTGEPTAQQVVVTLHIVFDTYPIQTGWVLVDTSTDTVLKDVPSGSYSPFVGKTLTETLSLTEGHQFELTVVDSGFDGLCCGNGNGSLRIFLGTEMASDQVLVYDDGQFTSFRSHQFVASAEETFIVSPSPTSSPTASPAPTITQAPTGSERPITVLIRMDGYPNEVGWSLTEEESGEVVHEMPPGTYGREYDNQNVMEVVFLTLEAKYIFSIVDSWGDGLCCGNNGGEVFVYFGEEADDSKILAYDDGNFGSSAEHIIFVSPSGILTESPSKAPSPLPSSSPSSSRSPSSQPSVSPTSLPTTTTKPSFAPTTSPTSVPTQTASPTINTSFITIAITFDRYPSDVGWYIYKQSDPFNYIANADEGTYTDQYYGRTVTEVLSVESNENYVLVITDAAGDGLCCGYGRGYIHVYLGNEVLSNMVLAYDDGNYWSTSQLEFFVSPSEVFEVTVGPTPAPVPFLFPPNAPVIPSPPTFPSPEERTVAPVAPIPFTVTLFLQLDNRPHEFGWALFDLSNTAVASEPPGTYVSPGQIASKTFQVYYGETYKLFLVDLGNNGICCDEGNGLVGMSVGNTAGLAVFFHTDGQFESFGVFDVTILAENVINNPPPFDRHATSSPSAAPSVVPPPSTQPTEQPISLSPAPTTTTPLLAPVERVSTTVGSPDTISGRQHSSGSTKISYWLYLWSGLLVLHVLLASP